MMLCTTLNKIRANNPCQDRWKHLLNELGKTKADDEPLSFLTILETNGLDDALWCCQSAPEYNRKWRLYAVWCARQVQNLMKDERSLYALNVAEKFADGRATYEELAIARVSAIDAVENCLNYDTTTKAAIWAATKAAEGVTICDASAAVLFASRDAIWAAAWAAIGDTTKRDVASAAGNAAWAAALIVKNVRRLLSILIPPTPPTGPNTARCWNGR